MTNKPQTISYPSPEARPRRHDHEPLEPHVIVLFGATGDLAKRKLIPGLAYLDQSQLAPDIQIVATSLEDLSDEDVLAMIDKVIAYYQTNAKPKERMGRFIDRIGLDEFKSAVL